MRVLTPEWRTLMTQTEIAKKLGIAQQTVSKILHGRMRMSPKLAKKAGEVFDADPALFVFGTPEEIRRVFSGLDKK